MPSVWAGRPAAFLALFVAVICLTPSSGHGSVPEADPKAVEVVQRAEEERKGYVGEQIRIEVEIRRPGSRTLHRTLIVHRQEFPGGEERVRFDVLEPLDLQNHRYLFALGDGDDEVWSYEPTRPIVKRVSPKARTRSFLGSSFAIEDLLESGLNHYAYRHLGAGTLNGRPTEQVQRQAHDAPTNYLRQVVHYDAEQHVILQIDSYDANDHKVKVATYSDFVRVGGRWRATSIRMNDTTRDETTHVKLTFSSAGTAFDETLFRSDTLGD